MTNKILKTWGFGMFTFGFIREWNSMFYKNRKDDYSNYSNRVLFSYLNGLYYVSPLGIVKLYHTYQRFKDQDNQNDPIYYEILGTNYEKFL